MRFHWITVLCLFGALIVIPYISSIASNDFYLYQDSNGDGTFDHRIHFKGDLMKELARFQTKSIVDTCWRNVDIWIIHITCGNSPPCPSGYSCDWTGSTAVAFYFNMAPCTCFTAEAERSRQAGDGPVYMATTDSNHYRQIAPSASEFNAFLMSSFRVVQDQDEATRCDASFTIWDNIICESNWFCPWHTCEQDSGAFVTGMVTLEPLCECNYVGPPPGPVLSHWGLVCLLVLLSASAVFLFMKRHRFSAAP
ncbi:MAG: hypothetical protein WCE90_10750 [Candidatus Zixiibacteriota bacterium]